MFDSENRSHWKHWGQEDLILIHTGHHWGLTSNLQILSAYFQQYFSTPKEVWEVWKTHNFLERSTDQLRLRVLSHSLFGRFTGGFSAGWHLSSQVRGGSVTALDGCCGVHVIYDIYIYCIYIMKQYRPAYVFMDVIWMWLYIVVYDRTGLYMHIFIYIHIWIHPIYGNSIRTM